MSRISEALKRSETDDPSFEAIGTPIAPVVVGEVRTENAAPAMVPPAMPVHAGGMDHAQPTEILEHASAKDELRLVASPTIQPLAVEQYRRLAAILHHTQEARGIRRGLVASALAEEGQTLTAINLALTLSQSYGRRVLLVDADLRRPGIGHVFGLPHSGGLSEALFCPNPEKLTLVQLSHKLSVLPAGHAMRDPMAGLSSPTL